MSEQDSVWIVVAIEDGKIVPMVDEVACRTKARADVRLVDIRQRVPEFASSYEVREFIPALQAERDAAAPQTSEVKVSEPLREALKLLFSDIRHVTPDEPPDRTIPCLHRVSDIRQAAEALYPTKAAQPIAPAPSAAPPLHECVHCGCDTYNASMVCDSCTTHVSAAPASTSEKALSERMQLAATAYASRYAPEVAALEVSRDQLRETLTEGCDILSATYPYVPPSMQLSKKANEFLLKARTALADPRSGENT